MPRRPTRLAIPALLAAALTAGCLAPASTPARAGTAAIRVFARLAEPADRRLAANPAPTWTAAEVDYVRFDVYAGASAVAYLTEYVDGADIRTAGTTLTFAGLAANTTYRIEARAYDDDDGPTGADGTLISKDQAPATSWKATVAVGTDDAPTPAAPITLQLLDRVFDGTSTFDAPDLSVAPGACTYELRGVVSTVVGGGAGQLLPPAFAEGGQGLATNAFDAGEMVMKSDGTLFVVGQHQVYMIDSDRKTYLLGGFGIDGNGVGYKDELGFNSPHGLALSADESELYVADFWNNRVIGIDLSSPDLLVASAHNDPNYSRVVAGGIEFVPLGRDGARNFATLAGPSGLALTPDGALLVTDLDGSTVRRIALSSADPDNDAAYVTTIAGAFQDAQAVDDGDASLGRFVSPYDIERWRDGYLIIDHGASAFRKLTPTTTGWSLTTFATAASFAPDASGDTFVKPFQLAVDFADRVWFTDRESDSPAAKLYLRCLDPGQATSADGYLRTWIGRSEAQDTGYVDGHVDDASFGWAGGAGRPVGVCVDRSGTVFFSDPSTNSVRKLQ